VPSTDDKPSKSDSDPWVSLPGTAESVPSSPGETRVLPEADDQPWPKTLAIPDPPAPPAEAPSSSGTFSQTQAVPGLSESPGPDPIPLTIGGGAGYQLLERIGKGQYGQVHRARAPGGVIVAVKLILRSLDDDSTQAELLALERIRELRHPFLLQTHNFQALNDRLVIVMELADGSLQDRFQECKAAGLPGIPPDELLRYFSEAAEALDFLHQQKLSHRDIKPQNLLHLKGHAKVADFGIARLQQNAIDQTVNVRGTPLYMAPEMWNGRVSRHSDQYSLAATWFQMRTGRALFAGESAFEIGRKHSTEKPDLSEVSEAEEQVLRRALAKDPDQRYPSCVTFVAALREALTSPPTQRTGAFPTLPVRSRTIKITIATLALALVAVAVALYLIPNRSQAPASSSPAAPPAAVYWLPKDWEPITPNDLVEDRNQRVYHRRLQREVGPQREKVTLVVVPQTTPTDPPTFYISENKVCNDLFAAGENSPTLAHLLKNYSDPNRNLKDLVKNEWHKGGLVLNLNADPNRPPFPGVTGEFKGQSRGRFPVFRVTVTEAHCFAEWLGGRLPTRRQWRKAAGRGEDRREGPFAGASPDKNGLVRPADDGPWSVDWGNRDVSIYGCRQMATNGLEWTRDLDDPGATIPLETMHLPPKVYVLGESYLSDRQPLTFDAMAEPRVKNCSTADWEVTFRIVLEP
jgi:serine/threonine protein kinase